MALLTKEQLLQKRPLERKTVSIPELGGEVIVRALSAKERDELDVSTVKRNGKKAETNLANFRARLCAACVVDAEGQRYLTEADAVGLGDQDSKIIGRIYDVAAPLCGITKADEEELSSKNSAPASA